MASRTAQPSNQDDVKKYFACPYFKHDMNTHSNCRNLHAKTFKNVLDHLKQTHLADSKFECSRCHTELQSQKELDAHRKRYPQCPVKHTDKTSKRDELRNIRRGQSSEDKWGSAFNVLFPGGRYSSPYDTDTELRMGILRYDDGSLSSLPSSSEAPITVSQAPQNIDFGLQPDILDTSDWGAGELPSAQFYGTSSEDWTQPPQDPSGANNDDNDYDNHNYYYY